MPQRRPISGTPPAAYSWAVPDRSRRLLTIVAVVGCIAVIAGIVAVTPAAGPPLRYVALGASDTVGAGALDPARDGWVGVLHAAMPTGTQLVNLGVNGARAHDALEQSLPVAIDARPDVATVWLAANDFNAGVSLDAYRRDLDRILAALQAAGTRWILVGNLPDLVLLDLFGGAGAGERISAEVRKWNAEIADVARAHDAVLVDLFAASPGYAGHPEFVSPDGGHPSRAGYAALADIFGTALRAAGGPVDGAHG